MKREISKDARKKERECILKRVLKQKQDRELEIKRAVDEEKELHKKLMKTRDKIIIPPHRRI